jgi:hypothetical protein
MTGGQCAQRAGYPRYSMHMYLKTSDDSDVLTRGRVRPLSKRNVSSLYDHVLIWAMRIYCRLPRRTNRRAGLVAKFGVVQADTAPMMPAVRAPRDARTAQYNNYSTSLLPCNK